MTKLVFAFVVVLSIGLYGCSSTKEAGKEEAPAPPKPSVKKAAVPEVKITIASVDLTTISRKIEKTDIEQLTRILKARNIDILAVQGIRRYPGLRTRLDVVDEITTSTGMRTAFGENINLSGSQTGNAVFTAFPIHTKWNTPYEGIRSAGFESALQAVVDCGVRDVVVVSTRFPERASTEDLTTCVKTLNSVNYSYGDAPVIISGNLPKSDVLRSLTHLKSAKNPGRDDAPHIWYSDNGSLAVLSMGIEPSPLGSVVIAEFGIFRNLRP